MEDNKCLEEVFVEPKLDQWENLCDEMLKEENSVLLCNLDEICGSDAYSGFNEVSNVEFGREINNDNAENNNLVLESYGNRIKDDDVPVWEGDFRLSRNSGVQDWKDEQPVKKNDEFLGFQVERAEDQCDYELHPHDPGSPTMIEVSGNNIDLFVEGFDPLDGISESNNDRTGGGVSVLGDNDSKLENSPKENGNVSYDVKSVIVKNEEGGIDGGQGYAFDLGDFVWVKRTSQLWWPGMIVNPFCSSVNGTKSAKKGKFLVKYFGNANIVWCKNSELKPFIECFEQITRLGMSRSLSIAMEEALCEVGKHVKLSMTCGCFFKERERNKEGSLMSFEKKKFESAVRLLSQFNPASFFAHIRHLAYSGNAPSLIELTLMKNCLSAFYCSIGHSELSLQQLRSDGDAAQNAQDVQKSELLDEDKNNISGWDCKAEKTCDDTVKELRRGKRKWSNVGAVEILDDKITSSVKGSESRERKKSKYLSYPYVDVKQTTEEQETDDNAHPSSLPAKSAHLDSCGGSSHLTSRNKWLKKHSSVRHIVSAADNIDACSAELLAELRATAQDCFYISRSKYSDVLQRFYSSFRVVSFLDADTASKVYGHWEESEHEKCDLQNSPKLAVAKESKKKGVVKEPKTKEALKVSRKRVDLAPVEAIVDNAAHNQLSQTNDLQMKLNAVHKRARKKKEQATTPGLINLQKRFYGFPNFSIPENREGGNPVIPEININSRLPDLNGNHPSLPDEQIPSGGPPPIPGNHLPKPRTEGLVSSTIINGIDQMIFPSPTPQNIPHCSNGVNATNGCWNVEFAGRQMEPHAISMGCISFSSPPPQVGFSAPAKSKHKGRKRKEKAFQVAPSVIPDLNGSALDTSSVGKTLPDGIQIPPEGVPDQKKRRRRSKSANAESGSDGKINLEDLGGSLLLSFAPGFALPSKEVLVAKFSRFGLLKESELQVLDDSSVQIVYERSSDARFAFRSVENSSPFGESLTGVKLHGTTAEVPRTKPRKNNSQMVQPFSPSDMCRNPAKFGGTPDTCKNKLQIVQSFAPPDACKNPVKASETTPDIATIRQNVEMMKMTLEKAGSSLPFETRLKLENEIKDFLDKISSVGGSSPS